MRQPAFWSLALAEITDPDFTHVAVGVLPAHATADPAAWARNLLSLDALPRWLSGAVRLSRSLRRRGTPGCVILSVRRVEGDEALVALDARRVDVRVGIGVDEESAIVRVVTAVRFKGVGAQRLSWPFRAALPFLIRGMIARARRDLSGVTRG